MSLRDRFGGTRRDPDRLRRELSRGGPVVVGCRLRRTSARGWGPWTEAHLHLGALPAGGASWSTDDAIAVGFASTNQRVELPFADVTDVYLRPVRFKTETFWGRDGDIIVVPAERATIEVAVPPGDAEAVAARLVELLRPDLL